MIEFIIVPTLMLIVAAVIGLSAGVTAVAFFGWGVVVCVLLALFFGSIGSEWDDNVAFSIWSWYGTCVYAVCWLISLLIHYAKTSGG